jgi:hypothetical protein
VVELEDLTALAVLAALVVAVRLAHPHMLAALVLLVKAMLEEMVFLLTHMALAVVEVQEVLV